MKKDCYVQYQYKLYDNEHISTIKITKHLNPEADPFLLRSLFVILTICSGFVFMIITYLIAAVVLQIEPLKEV